MIINELFNTGDRKFWDAPDKLQNIHNSLEINAIKDEKGEILNNDKDICMRFHRHYEKLANMKIEVEGVENFEPTICEKRAPLRYL